MLNRQFRAEFPFFTQSPDWVYLDSSATTLKPQCLIDTTAQFYMSAGSVHRSRYDAPQTQAYERARDLVAERFNVADRRGVIWTSGTTHSINLVAQGLAEQINAGDEIIISVAEHHANYLPWQQLAEQRQAKLIVLPLDSDYLIEEESLKASLSSKTKVVAFNLVSNITGVRQNAETLVKTIRQYSSAKVLIDMAQAVCCEKVDTQAIDADFYAFSAHKMYGPNGVGVLIGKMQSLAELRPLFFGGKMLQDISEKGLTLAELPYRLEAGTPNIAGIIGFGGVLEWLNKWDFDELNRSLYKLAEQARLRLVSYPNVQLIGKQNSPTISFVLTDQHYADIAAILTEKQIAVRVGEHCAKPYLRYLSKSGTLRLSLAHYNQAEDLTQFFSAFDFALDLLA